MRLKKRSALLLSFTLGALLLASTALADIANKDGYEQLKDSLKFTAEKCSTKLDSFTIETSMTIKNNGTVVTSEKEVKKYDRKNGATESISKRSDPYEYYWYRDKTTDIHYNSTEKVYVVTEYDTERENININNPFQEEIAPDLERIADALIGGLRNNVVVKPLADNGKEFSGSLSEVQIPALINALVSLQVKQTFGASHMGQKGFPVLTKDIYIKEVTGSARTNSEGILEKVLGTALIHGKDSKGNSHELSLELRVQISKINSTVVTKPDLKDKKVVKEKGVWIDRHAGISNPEKFLGKFKNDIIIEKEGKFVKVGERHLTITNINHDSVSGSYKEEYKPEFAAEYENKKLEFSFTAKFTNDPHQGKFTITSPGVKREGTLYFNEHGAKIELWFNTPHENPFDPTFAPVLE